MDQFAKIVNGSNLLAIFVKGSILDVWQVSENASEKNIDNTPDFKWKLAKANRNPTQGLKYFVNLKIFFGMLLCLTNPVITFHEKFKVLNRAFDIFYSGYQRITKGH